MYRGIIFRNNECSISFELFTRIDLPTHIPRKPFLIPGRTPA